MNAVAQDQVEKTLQKEQKRSIGFVYRSGSLPSKDFVFMTILISCDFPLRLHQREDSAVSSFVCFQALYVKRAQKPRQSSNITIGSTSLKKVYILVQPTAHAVETWPGEE